MRILVLSLYFSPDVAANAAIVTQIAEGLVMRGHWVTVVTAMPHYAGSTIESQFKRRLIQHDLHKGIHAIRTWVLASARKQRLFTQALGYVSFHVLSTLSGLFAGPQDLILAPSPPLTIGLSACLIGWLKRAPYVYNVQDIYPDVAVSLGAFRNRWVIGLSRWLERFVYRHARHVTVLSEGFRANLLAKGVPPDKVTVIPNFVDTDFVRPLLRDNDVRWRFGLGGRFLVLYAGNVGRSQNLEHVLECAALLQDLPDIAFAIVGNGYLKPRLEAQVAEMGLTNVFLLPFQPREDVPAMYAAADVSLVTLRRGIALQSVPSKAYTIMASGRPLIAAVDPGSDTWKMVEEAECGLCIRPEDPQALAAAIRRLYADRALRERLGRNGREHVTRHYTPQAVAEQYHQLLTRLVDGQA